MFFASLDEHFLNTPSMCSHALTTGFPSSYTFTALTLTSWLDYNLIRLPKACPESLKADCIEG